jgi:uncharacterized membrane protein
MPAEQPLASLQRWFHPRSIWRSIVLRPRIYLSALAGVLAYLLLPRTITPGAREALAWVIAGLCYIGFVVRLMAASTPAMMAHRAGRHDNSRFVIIGLIVLAVASSFVSIIGLMTEAKEASRHIKLYYLALASTTIIVSWCVMQLVFTLHYAHEFYRPEDRKRDAIGGLLFPGESKPDYWDFLYFATSIGATSQTSDVAVQSRSLRRLVTGHAVLSFFFNSAVLALTINLAASIV